MADEAVTMIRSLHVEKGRNQDGNDFEDDDNEPI